MKDYSQFFTNPESFITECDVDEENNVINTKFSNEGNNREFIYPLEKSRLSNIHNKLTNQYRKLIDNKKVFFKSKKRSINRSRKRLIISMIITAIGAVLSAHFNFDILALFLTTESLISCTGLLCNQIRNKLEKEEFDVYESYLNNNQELEKAVPREENILANIKDENTIDALEKQNSLYEKGLVDNVFNTFFMDKANVEDLKTILNNLKIYQGLNKENEIDITSAKTRSLKKNS